MYRFSIDTSKNLDFSLTNGDNFTIKKGNEFPLLELKPINEASNKIILENIEYISATFSMIDSNDCIVINSKPVHINIETSDNKYLKNSDSCVDYRNFTLLYKFQSSETDNIGFYRGEFHIYFSNINKKLIVPIKQNLNIIITP
jgi:hypothetical protein